MKRYSDGLSPSSPRSQVGLLLRFFDFVGVDPSVAVEFQRKEPLSYRFVDASYKWVESGSLACSTMEMRVSIVRGFFLANRAPLPRDRHVFHSEKIPVFGELTVEELRRILLKCNRTYQSAFLVQFQSGSGVGELVHINTVLAEHVWSEVQKGKRIIRLNMPGRKHNRNRHPYYTFIGSDAVDSLKRLFKHKGWKRDTVLFRNEYQKPVTKENLQSYFRRIAFRLGIIKPHTPACMECGGETVKRRWHKSKKKDLIVYMCTKCQRQHPAADYKIPPTVVGGIRYRMRTHELRDLFRTEWHRAQRFFGVDPDVGNFCMGHSVDRLKYDKIMRETAETMRQYRRAMPVLNVLSDDPRKLDRATVDDKMKDYEKALHELQMEMRVLERDLWAAIGKKRS